MSITGPVTVLPARLAPATAQCWHGAECELAYVMRCDACTITGDHRDDVRAAVIDCNAHNLEYRHVRVQHGFAHVRVVHNHRLHSEDLPE